MIEHIQINDVAPRIHYLADGVQAAFSYPFAIFKAGDLEVWLDEQRSAAGFTVSGAGISSGGAVLFAVPPAAGRRVTLRRRLVLERTTDYQADGIIRAKTLNDELDYQVAALQQVAEDLDRAVKRASTSGSLADLTLPEPVAGRALKWDAAAGGLTNTQVDPDALGSALADAQAARDTALSARDVAVLARDEAVAASSHVADPLVRANNLADLSDVAAAVGILGLAPFRNLGIGTIAGQLPPAERVMLRGKHSIWMPAAAMVKVPGANPSLDDFTTAGNVTGYKGWSLDAATAEQVCFDLDMPRGWNKTALDVEVLWSVAGAQTGNVRWGMALSRQSPGAAPPATWMLDASTLAATVAAAGLAHALIRTALPAIVLSGIADGDTLHVVLARQAADAADTLTVDAILRGVKIRYVTSLGSDD